MRLVNVKTMSLKEFIGSQVPEYAILSHTWEDEEVTYKDFTKNRHRGMKGFAKIEKTCQIAASEGLEWAWVDTCCEWIYRNVGVKTHGLFSDNGHHYCRQGPLAEALHLANLSHIKVSTSLAVRN